MVEGRHFEKRLSDATFGWTTQKCSQQLMITKIGRNWLTELCFFLGQYLLWSWLVLIMSPAHGRSIYDIPLPESCPPLVQQAAQIDWFEDLVGTLVGADILVAASQTRMGETHAQDSVRQIRYNLKW